MQLTRMMKRSMPALALALAATTALLAPGQRAAAADIYPWNDHAAPFSFRFGNDLDTHQQTRRTREGGLFGFFYISFTGILTRDRYRVATHLDCAMNDCTVGWTLSGQPLDATFLYHVENEHPIFLIPRPDIPQPGVYSHFHWLGNAALQTGQRVPGYALQLTAVDRFCFVHHDAGMATADRTCRNNGGVAVDPGVDMATHLNILPSRPPGL